LLSEFELINLFRDIGSEYYEQNGIVLSPGDDCAIIDLPKPLITSVDASVADIHFPSNASPIDIGYRSVAVALSDLAAMGCFPRAFSLSVTSPINDKEWYINLSKGVKEIAD
jgi:thiamine-monophosphate kinase